MTEPTITRTAATAGPAPSTGIAARPTGITILAVLSAIGGVLEHPWRHRPDRPRRRRRRRTTGSSGPVRHGSDLRHPAARVRRREPGLRLRRLDAPAAGPGPGRAHRSSSALAFAVLTHHQRWRYRRPDHQHRDRGHHPVLPDAAQHQGGVRASASTQSSSRSLVGEVRTPDPRRRVVRRLRTAATGSPATSARGAGTARSPAARRPAGSSPAPRSGRGASAASRRAPRRGRRGSAASPSSSSGASALAAPRPQHGPQLRHGREAHPVVDAVDVPAAVHRQDVPALAVGVVDRGIEHGHPPQSWVRRRDQLDDVDRRIRAPRRPGPCPRRTARRAARSAGRCPSRSPPRRATRRPRAGSASRPGSRRAGARRPSACRSPPAASTRAGFRAGDRHQQRVVARADDAPDDRRSTPSRSTSKRRGAIRHADPVAPAS